RARYGIIVSMDTSRFIPIEARSALSRATLPDPFFACLYRCLAPYRGCAHGCRYCDGRAEKYYVEGDFERDVAARTNLPDLVARDVAAGFGSREWGAVGIGSGVTDVYQPLERELGLTRRALEELVPAGLPVVILTKSDLILRDFDILARFPRVLVLVTVTTVDPEKARVLEPGAASPANRLEVVKRARAAGFMTGVMAMPLCPGITMEEESTERLFAACLESGAEFIEAGGVTLRPGRQKEFFLDEVVRSHYPDLEPLYASLFRENRQSGMPLSGESFKSACALRARLDALKVSSNIPHSAYRELLSAPDALFVLFCHMQGLYDARGVDTKPLRAATDRYAAWLSESRAELRRKRAKVVASDPFPITRVLSSMLLDLSANGGSALATLIGNERLARLASELIEKNGTFDYTTLSLRLS
ncbi:MAG TPA: radical SAM protein, partial [Treponemataceae bacterium]|nr:radical SAM protein [Treponemataceae bacterium]